MASTGGTVRTGATQRRRRLRQRRDPAMEHSGGMGRTGVQAPTPARPSTRSRSGRQPPDPGLTCLIVATAVAALAFLAAVALAAPTPAPSLATLLAAPPASDYKEDTTQGLALEGPFGLKDYVDFPGLADPARPQTTLRRDGVASGYGLGWVEQAASRL